MDQSFEQDFEHLKIQLKDIKQATNTFDSTMIIGKGGFGTVYKGELSHNDKGRIIVAIKRLDPKFGQGHHEFLKEIMVLNSHTHENLIALLGFCIEAGEMILVYEYASNKSLDRHISSTTFTWTRRLKICLGAARGLSFLHDAKGTKERVIHRDIKSANILLDANWNTKVSDMGMSRIAPANQSNTVVQTQAVGTRGYCDPMYMMNNELTKESDVYSFGVVLFEVLCGKLCYIYRNNKYHDFVRMWKQKYEHNKLHEIIFENMKQQIDQNSLKTYSNLAFECLQMSREARPAMSHVVRELEKALAHQEHYERSKLPKKTPLTATSDRSSLHNGILINKGTTWLSRNMNGDYCEMISIAECLTSAGSESHHFIRSPEYTSRFAAGCYEPRGGKFITHVITQSLSPQTTYTVNLVFKRKNSNEQYVGLVYKLVGENERSYLFVSDKRDDGWLTVELYQFTSEHQKTIDLAILFYTEWCSDLLVESIEFCPKEKVEHEAPRVENVGMQPEPNTETYWEQKLPIDYKEIIGWSVNNVRWRTKRELYHILCEGFQINGGKEWFFRAKDGKKCLMLPAKAVLKEKEWKWNSKPHTRFGQVADCVSKRFTITCTFSSKMLSPKTTYAAYLVYNGQPDEKKDINPPLQVVDEYSNSEEEYNIFLSTPKTRVITWNDEDEEEKTFNPSIRPKIKGLPKIRSDGWMEVQVQEFQTPATMTTISICLRFSSYDMNLLAGITVQGLEFKPI